MPGSVAGAWRGDWIVVHAQLELGGVVDEAHMRDAAWRVLAHVCQRLLQHPVGRQLHASRQVPAVPLDPQIDAEPRTPVVLDQRLERVEARLGSQGGGRVIGAQHTEQPAQLANRLPGRDLDRAQRLARPLRIALEHPLDSPGLDAHQADAVGDDVMELAGYSSPFGGQRRARTLLLLALGPLGAILEALRFDPPCPDEPTQQPGAAAERDEERALDDDQVAEGHNLRLEQHRDQHPDEADPEADQRRPQLRIGGHGVKRDQHRQHQVDALYRRAEHDRLQCDGAHHSAQRGERPPAAPAERQREQDEERRREPMRAAHGGERLAEEPKVQLGPDDQRDHDRPVEGLGIEPPQARNQAAVLHRHNGRRSSAPAHRPVG